MPTKKAPSKSIQNKQLSMDHIIDALAEMDTLRGSITSKKRQLKNLETAFEFKAKNSQERLFIQRSIDQLEADIQSQTLFRFEQFLRLIVRVRNLGSKSGSYTKKNFLTEVRHYLELKNL